MDKVTKYEIESFKQLLGFYESFEKSFKAYEMKLQCLVAECMIGDEDVIFKQINDKLLERMENQAAVIPGILDEIRYEWNELQQIVNGCVTQNKSL